MDERLQALWEEARARVAAQPVKYRPTMRIPKAKFHRCVVCEIRFIATRVDAVYCSNAHRQKAHRMRHRHDPARQQTLGLFTGGQRKGAKLPWSFPKGD